MNPIGIVRTLRSLGRRRNIEGMARFGIRGRNILGVPKPALDRLARSLGKDHALALRLWSTGVHEARILAALIEDPAKTTSAQMEKWVKGLDSWDLCDACCGHLFDRTAFAVRKAYSWSRRKREYEKRAGFVLMACLAVHDKRAPDRLFLSFLPVIRREAWDDRNFVKKAVNWALRQIGKRNRRLNRAAVREARNLGKGSSPSAHWIASDALRELTHPRTPIRNLPEKSV
jgi:3-methyladenine DNA glycosylase AlkD